MRQLRRRLLVLSPLLLALGAAAPASAIDLGGLKVPQDRFLPWVPGVEGGIPDTSAWPVTDVKAKYGAKGDGTSDDMAAIQAAINAAPAFSIVYLPPGHYNVSKTLVMKSNIVLKGAGPKQTFIKTMSAFTGTWGTGTFCATTGIHFCGGAGGPNKGMSGTLKRGDVRVTVSDVSGLGLGDYVMLSQSNDSYVDAAYDHLTMTHIAKVKAIEGNDVVLDRPLRHDFNPAMGPRLGRMDPIRNAGIEDLEIEFNENADSAYQAVISLRRAVNCWLRNLDIYRGWNYSVYVEDSARNTIEGSELHTLIYHERNPQPWNGYSVGLTHGAEDNLVTNNYFYDLYIQAILSGGASGNVVSYNYMTGGKCMHGVFFHGRYPHSNLIEGNDTNCMITFDNYWGRQGPYNVVFRNRVGQQPTIGAGTGTPAIRTHHDNPNSPITSKLSILGNFTIGIWQQPGCTPPTCFDVDVASTDMWIEDNVYTSALLLKNKGPTTTAIGNVKGTTPNKAIALPASLYRTGRPPFWPATKPWPAIGADVDAVGSMIHLPAQDRHDGISGGSSGSTKLPPPAPYLEE